MLESGVLGVWEPIGSLTLHTVLSRLRGEC